MNGLIVLANLAADFVGGAVAWLAAKRADALLELGDVDGQRVWKAVLRQCGS